jgi:MFS transporter, putative metabolite:H+ symporter
MQPSDTHTGFSRSVLTTGVIVAALGYFVDIYDLLLFSIVRKPSLESLGLGAGEVEHYGLLLINIQMVGMLIGGLLWGMLGDKKGRLSVLFGSIIIYSIANIANGFINEVGQYAIMRFIAGIGLAGELGAGITLVAESLPTSQRGYGTMIVASIGVSGAVFAGVVSHYIDWRACYFLGGALGLALLVLRISVYESGIFTRMIETKVQRGNFMMLLKDRHTFLKYLRCILIGIPTWFAIGILITFSPEFASKILHIRGEISGGNAIMYAYAGITAGDFLCGWLSQYLRSRRLAVFIFLVLTALGFLLYFTAEGASASYFYFTMVLIGLGTGFWAVIITNAAEQFGANIRATVATTVPNFIRGSLPIISICYASLQAHISKLHSAEVVACFIILIPMVSLYFMEETYGKNLDYTE